MKILFFIAVVLAIITSGCTDKSTARRVLSSNGYTNIRLGGYCWFSCSEDDVVSTSFTAISPAGFEVSGCVCEGLFFKHATIRFE